MRSETNKALSKMQKCEENDATVLEEYVVSHIKRHVEISQLRGYAGKWYRYGSKDDTLEPPHQIRMHFFRLH